MPPARGTSRPDDRTDQVRCRLDAVLIANRVAPLTDRVGVVPSQVVTHTERAYPPKQVVARAFSRFADSAYASMFESSESFAVWCKTGKLPAPPLPLAPPASGAVLASTPRPPLAV